MTTSLQGRPLPSARLPQRRLPRASQVLSGLACMLALGGLLIGSAMAQTFGSPQLVITAYKYAHITTDTTTLVKSGGGLLHSICVNTPAATETITVDDALTATTPTIAVITLYASTNSCFTLDVNFTVGLTIVTATAAGDITISYY